MDRGVWQATVHGVAKSQTQLSLPLATKLFAYELVFPKITYVFTEELIKAHC